MAQATFDPGPVPLGMLPATTLVVRYSSTGAISPLPNVFCVDVAAADGADPGRARFRYSFDVLNPAIWPRRVEQILGLDRVGPYVVRQDDQVVVLVLTVGGSWTVLFWGFVQAPQGDLGEGESATFVALGAAIREWDRKLAGAIYRNGPDVTVVSDTQTDLPARFNPDGKGNRVPAGNFAGAGTQLYPTFLDATDPVALKWSVADAAAYIIAQGVDGTYLTPPILAALAPLFGVREGDGAFDPKVVPPTPPPCQDLDVTGRGWPDALADLVRPHNFDFAFVTAQSASGTPLLYMIIYRTDDADNVAPKSVYLQPPGQALNPALSNLGGCGVARDGSKIANSVTIDSRPSHHEVGLVLAPAYTPFSGDAIVATASWTAFDSNNVNWVPANGSKYRVYVFDEAGDGHYDFGSSSFVTTIPSLDKVFGKPQEPPGGGPAVPQYANHRRPGRDTLFSKDPVTSERRHAKLFVSRNYTGPAPAVWDGSGSWSEVKSEWEFLPDRIGIRITTPTISRLGFGPAITAGVGTVQVNGSGQLSLVESQNGSFTLDPKVMSPRVMFMLVSVVESDEGIEAFAPARPTSIGQFVVENRKDERDRFVKDVICANSPFNATGSDVLDRDDTADAITYAEGVRAAHENPDFAGTLAIPWISMAYQVGDKIGSVNGRNINLRVNGGSGAGEAAQYPVVVGVTWTFEPRQSTTLHLSSRHAEPAPRRQS